MLAEAMTEEQSSVLLESKERDILSIFRRVRPEDDVPEALEAAYERWSRLQGARTAERSPAAPEPPSPSAAMTPEQGRELGAPDDEVGQSRQAHTSGATGHHF